MSSEATAGEVLHPIAARTAREAFEVFGPTVECQLGPSR